MTDTLLEPLLVTNARRVASSTTTVCGVVPAVKLRVGPAPMVTSETVPTETLETSTCLLVGSKAGKWGFGPAGVWLVTV